MSAVPKLLPFRSAGESAALSLPHDPAGVSPAAVGEPAAGRAALIDAHDRQQARERLAAIQPLRDFDANPSLYACTREELVERLCAEHDVSRRTLLRWQKRYREGGEPALADFERRDKGESRWFRQNEKAAWAAAYLHLHCRQSARAVYESLIADRGLYGIEELPSYQTVRAFLRSAPPFLHAYAIEGRRIYHERMAPYVSRGYTDVAPNQIWVSDHALHDVIVRNDCFPELEYNARMRLRITQMLDFRSRYSVGASWCPEGSSRSIATALRRAIAAWGPCSHFYCDNGKDYLKVARGAVPAWMRDAEEIRGWHEREMAHIERVGIFARLGIRVTHCIVRHPQSKHVERFFRTMHEHFDRRWHQHYTGGAPHLRPDATSAAMMEHDKLLRHGRGNASTLPTASFFIALAMEWIEEYNHRPHGGRGMQGRAPFEVFEDRALQTGIDPDSMALLLEEHRRLKVRECAVEWTPVPKGGSRRYTFFDDASRQQLHALNDTEVVVAFDPNDLDAVALLDNSGHFLTWAKPETYLRMDPSDPETQKKIAQSMSDRRHLEKQTRGVLEVIARNARAIGARTPVEALAERTSLVPVIESALTHRSPKPKPQPDAKAPMTAAEIATAFWRD
jgi:hypothetical protein